MPPALASESHTAVKISVISKWTLALALISIGRFLSVSVLQMLHPVDLVFEAPTWNTAVLLHNGINIYSPQTYDAPPFNLNIYTPLYFALVSIIPGFPQSPLIVGRAVSLFFTAASVALLVFTTARKDRFQMGLIGVGWFLLFSPVLVNGAFFRMEFMALFFSACAIAALRTESPDSKATAVAALFAVLSILTKQTYFAAFLSGFIYLACRDLREAVRFAGIFSLLLGSSLGLLYWYGGEGFFWSILVAPRNPFTFAGFLYNVRYMLTPAFVVLLGLSAAAGYVMLKSKAEHSGARPGSLNVIYYLISWMWLFASVGKIGATTNYFIEPLFASVWLLMTWVDAQEIDWMARRIYRYAFILLPLVLAADILITRYEPRYLLPRPLNSSERFQRIKREMEGLNIPASPKVLNLAQTTHSLSVGWDLYLNDPVLYNVLWNTGKLSNQSLLTAIDNGYFDVIALPAGSHPLREGPGSSPFRQVYQKVFDRYEIKSEATFGYYVPRKRTASQ
jgi:hypothetical protein